MAKKEARKAREAEERLQSGLRPSASARKVATPPATAPAPAASPKDAKRVARAGRAPAPEGEPTAS